MTVVVAAVVTGSLLLLHSPGFLQLVGAGHWFTLNHCSRLTLAQLIPLQPETQTLLTTSVYIENLLDTFLEGCY